MANRLEGKEGSLFIYAQEVIAILVSDLLRVVKHVFAQVAICGDRFIFALVLGIAGIERRNKGVELGAAVIDVELALHLVAGGNQHVGQRIAEHGVAGATIVDWAGGIGAYIFNLP